jgi:CheY-like chemotaxis protein
MTRKIKMLIVEDNEDERLFMKEGFIQSGLYEIVGEAENGDEMLELLNESSFPIPEVILSDLNMPGRNGYEVIMDVKTNSSLSHIPIIILTTAPLVPFADRCKELGACAYFTKPDTFLEYKDFAEKIYGDIKECLGNTRLDYSSIKKLKENFVQKALQTCLPEATFFLIRLRSCYVVKHKNPGGH